MSHEQRPQSVATLSAMPFCPICGVSLQGKHRLLAPVPDSAVDATAGGAADGARRESQAPAQDRA